MDKLASSSVKNRHLQPLGEKQPLPFKAAFSSPGVAPAVLKDTFFWLTCTTTGKQRCEDIFTDEKMLHSEKGDVSSSLWLCVSLLYYCSKVTRLAKDGSYSSLF